jgi:serine/threonine protein kinase/Tfp pilus assembly protein PilF
MTTWNPQANEAFLKALELHSADDRQKYLEAACAGEPQLRAEVEAMLEAHGRAGSFLESAAPAHRLAVTMDEPITERPGTVIGPYKLLEQIGEGGFGVVFMAEQQAPIRRKVALKVLKPGMDTRQVVARFEAERQALALMDHPNIAKVLDAGQTSSGRPYFVMDLVKGLPITDFCDQSQLTPRQRLELFLSVCQAVQHAHQKGIIHRDLKPTNVLVTLHDGRPLVKVIDFGVAKALGQQLTDKTLFTNFAQMIGTPLYMSPEQAAFSNVDVDTRSDIYSLGVLLYELLTGTTPFDKERFSKVGYGEICRIIREEEPPKPSTRISTLGQAATTVSTQRKSDPNRLSQLLRGELDWIVMKCLEKDRNRRYESASAFAADVQRYLNDEPVQACPPSTVYRLGKFARRHRAGLAVAACLLGALAVLAGSVGWVAGDRVRSYHEAAKVVQRNLEEARQLQQQGRWREARAAVRGAEGLLANAGDPEDLRSQCRQVRADLEMLAKIEQAKLDRTVVRGNRFDTQAADRAYRAAFEGYGLPVLELQPQEAAERIATSAIAQELVAALDDWAWFVSQTDDSGGPLETSRPATPNLAQRAKLLAVAQQTDPDPWRQQVRDAISRGDGTRLLDLSRHSEVLEQSPATLLLLAHSLVTTDLPTAIKLLRDTQRQHPDDFWINHELGKYLRDHKPPRLEEAIGYFRTALALRPQSPGVYVNLGQTLANNAQFEEAFGAFQHAVELKPDYAVAHNDLGACLIDLGQPAEGMRECQEALRLEPEYPCALFNLSLALMAKNKPDHARAALEKAIRLDPEFARAADHLAWLLANCPDAKVRDTKRAVELAQKAVQRQPNADNWNTLGAAYYRAGKWREAIETLEKATIARENGNAYDWFFLAMAHGQLGEKEKAKQVLQQAVQWMHDHKPKDQELGRFRAEAEELLKINHKDARDTKR